MNNAEKVRMAMGMNVVARQMNDLFHKNKVNDAKVETYLIMAETLLKKASSYLRGVEDSLGDTDVKYKGHILEVKYGNYDWEFPKLDNDA